MQIALTGRYVLVQIKDVDKRGFLNLDALVRVEAPEARKDHLLHRGDVLLVARGNRNRAAVFAGEIKGAIAGAQFYIIRPKNLVLPEYLAWYLNQTPAQRQIEAGLAGSFVPFIPREALDELLVAVPTLEEQRRVVAVHELWLKEQELMEQISGRRQQLVQGALMQAVKPLSPFGKLTETAARAAKDLEDHEND